MLLDEDGCVNETPTANLLGYRGLRRDGEWLFAPHPDEVLPGISLEAVTKLAARRWSLTTGPFYRNPDEFCEVVDELFLTSTPFCLLPVAKVDDREIGDGRPGPMFAKLLQAWSEEVGVDIAEQARRFTARAQ